MVRPQYRDYIRRQLQILPPIDAVPPGPAGAQPDWASSPTNAQINDCLQAALSDINIECGSHVTQLNMTVAAQTGIGPQVIHLGDLTPAIVGAPAQIAPVGQINDIQRVVWQPDPFDSAPQLLRSGNRDALDRNQSSYYRVPPSMPQFWYVESYTLYVWPAQNVSGTYVLTAGTGFIGLQTENDAIDQLPLDFQPTVAYQAIVNLSIMSTMDAESAERAQSFGGKALEGMRKIAAWKRGAEQVQPSLKSWSYRQSYGTRRIRR